MPVLENWSHLNWPLKRFSCSIHLIQGVPTVELCWLMFHESRWHILPEMGLFLHTRHRCGANMVCLDVNLKLWWTDDDAASCDIRYYLNYSVDIQARLRRYYDKEIPEVIHLEEHSFIQTSLSELFTASTLFAWVSWQNTALIYNHALSPYGHEEVNESRFVLTSIQVRRAFVLTSLLKDWRTRGHSVVMREQGDLDSRLKDLICEHNNRMIIEGQPERLHACKTCEKLITTDLPNSYKGLREFL